MNNPYDIALSLTPGLTPKQQRLVLMKVSSAEELFTLSKTDLISIIGNRPQTIDSIINKTQWKKVEQELRFMEQYGITALSFTDHEYPQRMNQPGIDDCPIVIYQLGKSNLNPDKSLAFVGTRKASEYGKKVTSELIKQIPSQNISIISGLALGIDTEAHTSSLNNDITTISVLGHGLDTLYPESNRNLAKRILNHGGSLLTEYPSQSVISRYNFPARNRIIAAISDATIVIEAAEKGGALITAAKAKQYNRPVYALPGRTLDKNSLGCNNLIANGDAKILTSIESIFEQMHWGNTKTIEPPSNSEPLSFDEQIIFNALSLTDDLTLDDLAIKTALPTTKIAISLLNMEFKGIIKALPGNRYKIY